MERRKPRSQTTDNQRLTPVCLALDRMHGMQALAVGGQVPRIRRLKVYDQIIPSDLWTQRGDEEDADGIQTSNQAGEFSLGTTNPVESVRGWYSDTAIIATMPDAKLREAYQRHKTLAQLCQQEITRRHVTGSSVRATAQFDVRCGMHRFVPVGRTDCYYQRPKRRASKAAKAAKAGQLTLAPEQMLKALSMLLTLKKQG